MAHKESKFLHQQKIALGVGAVVVLAVLAYVTSIVIRDSAPLGNYVAGEHYTLLENPKRVRGDKIEVVEFFSYACIHCYRFDPDLEGWVEDNQDRIKFIRNPVVASDLWARFARHYYTMESLGIVEDLHYKFFNAVHDRNLNTSSKERLAEWAEDNGVENYLESYDSAEVRRKVATADATARGLQIANVPSMVINGKYLVRITETVGPVRMLDIVDHLLQLETAPPPAQ
jgi:protein dithiol oxidoreductase (disulfide-forming)